MFFSRSPLPVKDRFKKTYDIAVLFIPDPWSRSNTFEMHWKYFPLFSEKPPNSHITVLKPVEKETRCLKSFVKQLLLILFVTTNLSLWIFTVKRPSDDHVPSNYDEAWFSRYYKKVATDCVDSPNTWSYHNMGQFLVAHFIQFEGQEPYQEWRSMGPNSPLTRLRGYRPAMGERKPVTSIYVSTKWP